MKLSVFKMMVENMDEIRFQLPNGTFVPSHFHITEIGSITKHFIDCGGIVREEKVVNFQLWHSDDLDHQLKPNKVLKIINLSQEKLKLEDHEIEVEFQAETIGKYGLKHNGSAFELTTKMTDCLAKDNCGIPEEKPKLDLGNLIAKPNSCTPGGGCC